MCLLDSLQLSQIMRATTIKVFLFFVIAFCYSPSLRAGEGVGNYWIELHWSFIGNSISANSLDDDSGWSITFNEYNQYHLFEFGVQEKSTNRSVFPSIRSIGLLRTMGGAYRYGYYTLGTGLAYTRGELAYNCVAAPETDLLFSGGRLCDIKKVTKVGVPIHLSLAVGRYAGLGVFFDLLFTKGSEYALVGIYLPLGKFTK